MRKAVRRGDLRGYMGVNPHDIRLVFSLSWRENDRYRTGESAMYSRSARFRLGGTLLAGALGLVLVTAAVVLMAYAAPG
jgi:hypothetical protein